MTAAKPTQFVDNRFKLDVLIGAGGFGRVYKAEDRSLNRVVALKMLDVLNPAETDATVRFEREAKVLSGLRHAHIVSVYNYGQDESGRPYISMQYLDGQTVADLLHADTKLPWQRAVAIISQVCEALSHAHSHGVVHRDLKPENVMLLAEPTPDYVQVLDFGLSGFAFGVEGALQKLTQTGSVVGTVYYMSPEVCLGQRADHRSDVYALGCILYQCVTGELPITGDDSLQLLYKHVHDLPPRLRQDDVPPELELVIFKAMQKDPDARFQSMAEFQAALDVVLSGKKQGLDVAGVQLEQRSAPRIKSKKVLPYVIAAVLAALAGIVVFSRFSGGGTAGGAIESNREYNLGRLLWTRREHLAAKQHLLAAAKAAPDKKSRFLSDFMAARYALLHTLNGGTDPAVINEGIDLMQDAINHSENEIDRAHARMGLGILAHQKGDWEQTYQALHDEPWKQLKDMYYKDLDDLFFEQRGPRALGDVLMKAGPHQDAARGKKLIASEPAPGTPSDELREGVHIFSQNATTDIGILQRSSGINLAQDRPVQEITEIRYKVRHAESEKEMLKAIAEAQAILAQNPDNNVVDALGRTYVGLGYYDIGHFADARKYIMNRPWTRTEPGELKPEWSEAGDCCVAAIKLMFEHDPDAAIALLEPLLSSGDIDEEFFAFTQPRAQFFLATAYMMKNDPRADDLFKIAMPHRTEILFDGEQKFIKDQLTKHGKLALWK